MPPDTPQPLLPPPVSKLLGWSILYFLIVVGCFTFPNAPSAGLDPSWRMALGYFYENGTQFGREVVFTYGPLGFVMGKTFSGLQFWSLIVGQAVLALVSAAVLILQGWRLPRQARLVFFLCLFLFGIGYEDSLHMIVIAILGFELLRRMEEPRRHWIVLIAAILAGYAQIKFTDLLLAAFAVAVAAGYGLWQRRHLEAALLVLAFLAVYLGIWVACDQSLLNLPAYLQGSWEISSGYQWAMAFPTPLSPLWKALLVLLTVVAYAVIHLLIEPRRPRAVANFLMLGAFIYLNWKHGFVRADGHMVGFFFCALLPLTAYPALLDDPDRFRFAHRWAFVIAIILSVWGLETALSGSVHNAVASIQGKIWGNFHRVTHWEETRQVYRDQLAVERAAADLHQTRRIVGSASLDVIGCEQSVALFNKFNYRPRPLIQSYSTFTPPLARLNYEFIISDRAPEFILTRIETIDGRLLSMDDAQVLRFLPYRYEYVHNERGFLLWQRRAAPVDAASLEPRPIRTDSAEINRPLVLADLAGRPLWVRIDLQPSLLGRLRAFLYKPPQVMLRIEDTSGNDTAGGTWDYLMPLPQGRNGFILNPIIGDLIEYMHYANNTPLRWTRQITLKVAQGDVKFFSPRASVELSALPPLAKSAEKFFPKELDRLFHMFRTHPVAFESHTGFTEAQIDGRSVAIMHAPSRMIFDVPTGARMLSGSFGFMAEAYTGNARTNGAGFLIYWSNGADRIELFKRYLDPYKNAADRGLQNFSVELKGAAGGRLYFEVDPGPHSDIGWDWTGWTDIRISQ